MPIWPAVSSHHGKRLASYVTGAALLWLWLLVPRAGAAESVELRYRFASDQQLAYLVKVRQQVRLSSDLVAEAARTSTINSEAEMLQRVLAIRDGRARLQISLGSFRASQATEGLVHELRRVPEMEGIRLVVTRDEHGRVLKTEELGAEGREMRVRQVALAFARAQQLLTLEFPSRTVAAGESWQVERRVEVPLWSGRHLQLVMQGDYTLERLLPCRRQRCARISARVRITLAGRSDLGDIQLRADLQGSGRGRFLFGLDTGNLIRSECQTEIKGRLSAADGDERTATGVNLRIAVNSELVR